VDPRGLVRFTIGKPVERDVGAAVTVQVLDNGIVAGHADHTAGAKFSSMLESEKRILKSRFSSGWSGKSLSRCRKKLRI
jgi:hypothetical protein